MMSGYPFTGPTAAQTNPPIEPQYFSPLQFRIAAIALGRTTTVTTSVNWTENNDFVIGQQVRFIVPWQFGTRQLDGQTAFVMALPATNQVTVNLDTSIGYSPFISSPTSYIAPAQLLPIGSINTGFITSTGRNATQTTIPGAFSNISS